MAQASIEKLRNADISTLNYKVIVEFSPATHQTVYKIEGKSEGLDLRITVGNSKLSMMLTSMHGASIAFSYPNLEKRFTEDEQVTSNSKYSDFMKRPQDPEKGLLQAIEIYLDYHRKIPSLRRNAGTGSTKEMIILSDLKEEMEMHYI